MKLDNLNTVFRKVLVQGSLLIIAIAIIGSLAGGLAAGMPGVLAAVIGSAMTLVFVSLTALSVWLGGRFGLGAFFGIVMGGWLLKIVLFMVLVRVLLGNVSVHGPTFFFTVVAAILGSLVVDSLAVLKARIPVGEN